MGSIKRPGQVIETYHYQDCVVQQHKERRIRAKSNKNVH